MTPNQFRILRALTVSPQPLRFFTHCDALDQTRISPSICAGDMNKLLAAGYVELSGRLYFITKAGAAEVDLATPQPKLAIPTEPWKPKPWSPPREGSGRVHESLGTPC
jgi:hypothetical protein